MFTQSTRPPSGPQFPCLLNGRVGTGGASQGPGPLLSGGLSTRQEWAHPRLPVRGPGQSSRLQVR